jgi:protein-arginine kinase activator protein McsA
MKTAVRMCGSVKETELMGNKYEKVESFKYLGAMIISLNDIETEIKSKIAIGENNRVCTDCTRTYPNLLTVWFSILAGTQHWTRTKYVSTST